MFQSIVFRSSVSRQVSSIVHIIHDVKQFWDYPHLTLSSVEVCVPLSYRINLPSRSLGSNLHHDLPVPLRVMPSFGHLGKEQRFVSLLYYLFLASFLSRKTSLARSGWGIDDFWLLHFEQSCQMLESFPNRCSRHVCATYHTISKRRMCHPFSKHVAFLYTLPRNCFISSWKL